ncbi:MAG: hypothetical protein RLZZ111_1225 [Planctomycetota bacterium]|jgi:hypothetical protein
MLSAARRAPADRAASLTAAPRSRRLVVPLLFSLAAWSAPPPGACARAASPFDADVRPLLAKYCFDCHSGKDADGGVALDECIEAAARSTDRAVWQKVLRQLQGQAMPPRDAEQPTAAERNVLEEWVAGFALKPDCSRGERPGRVTLRRLNRAEYNNTIRDLFGIDIAPADEFPSDDVGYGFDNIGDVLSVSPVLMERYLLAAEKVAEAVIFAADVETAAVRLYSGKQLNSTGDFGHDVELPESGSYVIRVRAAGILAGPDPPKMTISLDKAVKRKVDVRNGRPLFRDFDVKLNVPSGKHRIDVGFLNDYYAEDPETKKKADRNLAVDKIAVIGPIGVMPDPLPEPHLRFFKKPIDPRGSRAEQYEQAKEILKPLASRAFRRRATDLEVEALADVYEAAREGGQSIERAMQAAVTALLAAPSFLFRVEQDPPPDKIRRLDGFELASRLSYFLWSSMPDDELFRAAARGELDTDEQVVAAALRMLRDDKARALVENFAGQWLQLRSLADHAPDRKRFPGFDDDLRAAMRRETEEFFWSIVRDDRSVLDFLDADYTFVNERLAKHYGIPGVTGDALVRVSIDPDRRGGLLGQASVLTVTSNPTRTSPVKRGKWILENLFAAPPPAPPPNVPELEKSEGGPLTGTLRQRMEQHRADPACAACHQLMDPLGFGLENFDAVGGWRTRDGDTEVDAGGELPGGRSFKGPKELRRVLLDRKDEFRRCLAEKLLTYALGRGLEWYDACAVERIAGRLAAEGDRFSVLVEEIVRSPAFRKRESSASR